MTPRRRLTLAEKIAALPSPATDQDFWAPAELRQAALLISKATCLTDRQRRTGAEYWRSTRWRRRECWLNTWWMLQAFYALKAKTVGLSELERESLQPPGSGSTDGGAP